MVKKAVVERKRASKSAVLTRDAEATKNRILDAAEEEFARGGLLGARTEAIAANTQVTKAMIYYYFEDKEKLYQAVLERAFARRVKSIQNLDLIGGEPEETVRSFLSGFLEEVSQHPNISPILFHEAMQNKGRYYKDIAIAALYAPLSNLIIRGVSAGKFRNVEPRHAAVNIIGACVFYFCSRENVKHLWDPGVDLLSRPMLEQHIREAVDFVVAGLKK